MRPPEKILLCRVSTGAVEYRTTGRHAGRVVPGRIGVVGFPHGGDVAGRVHAGHVENLLIEPRLLGEGAGPAPGDGVAVRLTGHRPISAAAGHQLAATFDYVRRSAVLAHSRCSPLLVATIERHVAAVLLMTLPTTALLEPTPQDRRDSTPALMTRAMRFIDDNAHRDVSLTDIATSIHVTPRALQYMFRKHRDCTPTQYVRRVRLHHAHLDLVAGNATDCTVSRIATTWGFGHLGRFAILYRQHYGRSPHVTLRY